MKSAAAAVADPRRLLAELRLQSGDLLLLRGLELVVGRLGVLLRPRRGCERSILLCAVKHSCISMFPYVRFHGYFGTLILNEPFFGGPVDLGYLAAHSEAWKHWEPHFEGSEHVSHW